MFANWKSSPEVLMKLNAKQEQFLEDIISYKSIHSTSYDGAPYGKASREVLDFFLKYAQNLGFITHVTDDKVGYVEFGQGKDMVALVCHLDVVPASNWGDIDPFKLTVKDGCYYGRGIIDNKGPACASLFAMQNLMNQGFTPNQRIRLILGTDEEVSCDCVETYSRKEETPIFAITPDAEFPVVFAEKGIMQIRIFDKTKYMNLTISGGQAVNAVPDSINILFENEKATLKGKTAHASKPQLGDNAISKVPEYLEIKGASIDSMPLIAFIKKYCSSNDPVPLTGCKTIDCSGKTTFNPGVIQVDDNIAQLDIDIRYPISASYDSIVSNIDSIAKHYNLAFEVINHMPPICQDKESTYVQKLTKIWIQNMSKLEGFKNEYLERYSMPIAIGGGTYARHIPNTIAFGMQAPWQEDQCHQANEHITVSDFVAYVDILEQAIIAMLEKND